MERSRCFGASALVLALMVVFPVIVSAASWRPRVGIEAGPSLGRMSSTDLLGSEQHWTLGGAAGMVARWDLGSGWALEAAPGWERPVGRRSGTIVMTSGGSLVDVIGYDQTFRFDRVALPVRAAFHPGGSSWSIEGGMSASWLAHAGQTQAVTYAPTAAFATAAAAGRRPEPTAAIFEGVGTFDRNDWTNLFNRWDAAAVAGVGWDHALATHVLRARVRWQQGLTNIGKFGTTMHVSAASAAVGMLW